MDLNRLSRVAIVGTSCSGKTILAHALSRPLGAPHTELDALYWGPNWTPLQAEDFRSRVQAAVAEPSWVVDGNYSIVRDLVWSNATTLVWLNYPFFLVFPRSVRRTFRRIVTRELLFSGNRELFTIADPGWIPWWVVRSFWRHRREYPAVLRQPAYSHLQVLEFTWPDQAERFLSSCAVKSRDPSV